MEVLDNRVESDELVLMLHGASEGINSHLFKSVFDRLRVLPKKVSMLEFSFIKKKVDPDSDQIVESKEVEDYLRTQNYRSLSVIGHSNGGFVALVATTRGIVVNHLLLLGLSHITKEGTKQAIAEIIKKIISKGNKVAIVQPEKDPYSTPTDVRNFIKEFNLDTTLYIIPGDHYFRGAEEELADLLSKLLI